jgi:protein-tyrosine kinase
MNDQTPRRYKGSLLERAAPQFHYAPAPVEGERVAPPRVPASAFHVPEPVVEAPVPEPEVVRAPEPEVARAPEPEVVHAPEPEPVAAPLGLAALHARKPVAAPAPQPVEAEPVRPTALRSRPVPELPAEPQIAFGNPTRRVAPIDREALAARGMLAPGGPITPLAEEFRMVKRQLLLTARAVAAKETARAADRARMILVCSAQPNEGKTFCAINLALSMATEKDVEVLLVDADFAKPDVLDRMGLPNGPGLLDVLAGAVDSVEDCIIDTDVPQLSVLPAGTKTNSDTELLASDRARALLDGLAAANPRRIVIFDSPPALAASPASVLASHVGQTMLVVRADRTSESDLRAAVSTLDGCEHIQLVLNSVSFQPGGRRFGSYYEYGEGPK